MKNRKSRALSTRAVHAGEHKQPGRFIPVATPIQPSVGYIYESMDDVDAIFAGEQQGYVYSRYANPTVTAFEEAMADLEGAEAAHAFGSGMAALHMALLAAGVKEGTSVVAAYDVYGATFTLLRGLFSSLGVQVRMVNAADLAEVQLAIEEVHPSALLVETISNPLLKVADVPALAGLAHQHGAQLLVDNTFATPYLFTPQTFGADFTIHSATKYIGGHGDVMAGVVASSAANKQKMFELNKLVGSLLGPFEAWLALRGLKTLPLRVRQQCQNAQQVAERLARHPRVSGVNYPGLPAHPQHELARSLFGKKGFGGMMSFEISGADKEAAFRFMESLELCQPATTLGDIYSLVLHPASSSHRSLTPEERRQVGIPDGMVRLSVGIEEAEDIITDLEQALSRH